MNCLPYKSPEMADITLLDVPVDSGVDELTGGVEPIEIQPLTLSPKVV
jgi:hypothetical protein